MILSLPSCFQGGLKAQHLSGIQAISEMYSGVLVGAAVDSCEVEFKPRVFTPGQYLIDIKTAGSTPALGVVTCGNGENSIAWRACDRAGSVALVVQATLPCMLFGTGPSQLKIMGGTNVTMAPQVRCRSRTGLLPVLWFCMSEILRPSPTPTSHRILHGIHFDGAGGIVTDSSVCPQ